MTAGLMRPSVKSNAQRDARKASVREIAVRVLSEWSQQKQFAQDLLDEACRRHHLSPPDAGLLHHIVLGVLRNLSLLDHWISTLCSHPHLDHHTRWVLRIGLAQLLLLDMPPHAAVNETVEIAGKARSIVNAILRRADRERAALLGSTMSLPLEVRTSHPGFLVRRWRETLGAERADALCGWNQDPAGTFVRLNPLHPGAASWMADACGLEDVGGGFYRCESLPREALAAGLCYAQDPATAIATVLLGAQPGDAILDACAAPGGKTAMLAAMMNNQGRIIASDSSEARLKRLRENLSILRVTNAGVFVHDLASDKAAPWGDTLFDRILLDVPCSNTGVMRRRVDVRWRLREEDFSQFAAFQSRLLQNSLRFLKPGGTVVYSTCSIDQEENRGVIDRVLAANPALALIEERLVFPPADHSDGAYAARLVLNRS
jgi:16S rRNA (cytosine967-C5)-methyltransferase